MKLSGLLAATLVFGVLSLAAKAEASDTHTRYLPQSAPPATSIVTADVRHGGIDIDIKLATVSLQGLVNASVPRLYVLGDPDPNVAHTWLLDYYRKIGVVTSETRVGQSGSIAAREDALLDLIATFQDEITGLAVIPVIPPPTPTPQPDDIPSRYDHTLNAATNAAGVLKLLIVTEPLIDRVRARLPVAKQKIVWDFRTTCPNAQNDDAATCVASFVEPTNPYLVAWWSADKFLQEQSTEALAHLNYDASNIFVRDYVIAHKIHTFWYPNEHELTPFVRQRLVGHLNHVLHHAPANIPVLGDSTRGGGECPLFRDDLANKPSRRCGLTEYQAVQLFGQYGKFSMALGHGGGFSFHSGVRVNDEKLRQYRVRSKKYRTYKKKKKYVAFTMNDSGDSPAYLQTGLKLGQWGDPYRGAVPVSYGLSLSSRDLLPGLLQYVYETATANDYFFASISGLGYMYPLDGYGQFGVLDRATNAMVLDEAGILHQHYRRVADRVHDMDINAMGLWTRTEPTPWTPAEDAKIGTYMVDNLPKLTTIASDMGALDYFTNPSSPIDPHAWIGLTALRLLGSFGQVTKPMPEASVARPIRGVGVHHALTNWWRPPPPNPKSPGESHGVVIEPKLTNLGSESDAVRWLVEEIKLRSDGQPGHLNNQFVHAVALSWHYGPRRLWKVMQELAPLNYEFVTLDELDDLWRQANALPRPTIDPHQVLPPHQPSQWCTHPGSVLLRGDVNADGVADEICHDSSGYWWTRGVGLSGNELASLNGRCVGESTRVYAGEWTGDDVVDFLCYDAINPLPRTLLNSTASSPLTYEVRTILKNSWCTHTSAWMEAASPADRPLEVVCSDQTRHTWYESPNSLVDTGYLAPELWSSVNSHCADGTTDVCQLGDVTGDGKADIVIFKATGAVWVAAATTAGMSFDPPVQKISQFSAFCLPPQQACEVGDVNGDGYDDLVAFNRGNGPAGSPTGPIVRVRLSTGSGFGAESMWHSFFCLPGALCKVAKIQTASSNASILTFTNDANGYVWVALANAGGTAFGDPQLWKSGFCTAPGHTCELGDVNNDGKADLVAFERTPNPVVRVWLAGPGAIPGTFGEPSIWSNYFCLPGEVCKVGDVDHDGRADVVAFTHNAAPLVWVAAAADDATHFLTPVVWSNYFCTSTERCLLGDMNGDGAVDAVAFTGPPNNRVWVARTNY